MTLSFWLRDIAAFGGQTAALIIAAAVLAFVLRIREPRTALVYWRVVLVACVLLPFCQTWKTIGPPAIASTPLAAETGRVVSAAAEVPSRDIDVPQLERLLVLMLAAGTAARALWIAAGAWSLRRLRRRSAPFVPLPGSIAAARDRLGVSAEFRLSERVAGPITFGARRPVILLPPRVSAMAPHVQEAIAYHELIHVRRRDWLQGMLEEAVRTILWFHPAVHWLIGRIQLTREQVVDRAVIALTNSRERYVEALLAVAIGESSGALVPAPLFLRRKALKRRVAQILEEATMNTRRLIASVSLSAAALVLTAIVGVRAFPLQAQGQERTGAPVQIVSGGEHLLHGALPEYPRGAFERRVEGDVVVDLTVDEQGEVADARVVSGPDELRKSALQSVLGWHYSPDAVRSTSTQATLRFHVPPEGTVTYRNEGYAFKRESGAVNEKELTPTQRTERRLAELEKALRNEATSQDERAELERKLVDTRVALQKLQRDRELLEMNASREETIAGQQTDLERVRAKIKLEQEMAERGQGEKKRVAEGARITQLRAERVPDAARKEVIARAGVEVGQPFTEEIAKRLQEAAASVDEHFRVSFRPDDTGGIIVTLLGPGDREIR